MFCRKCGGANSEERIKKSRRFALAVDFDAELHKGDGKRSGVGTLTLARLDGIVGDKPSVSPAAEIYTTRVPPAGDVRFENVGHSSGAAVQWDGAGFGKMKYVLVAVVYVALGVDGLKMACGDLLVGGGFYGDGFHPMESILEGEKRIFAFCEREDELVREKWIGGGGSNV